MVVVCPWRGTRSEVANDGVAGTTPVRWTVVTMSVSSEVQDGVVRVVLVRRTLVSASLRQLYLGFSC